MSKSRPSGRMGKAHIDAMVDAPSWKDHDHESKTTGSGSHDCPRCGPDASCLSYRCSECGNDLAGGS